MGKDIYFLKKYLRAREDENRAMQWVENARKEQKSLRETPIGPPLWIDSWDLGNCQRMAYESEMSARNALRKARRVKSNYRDLHLKFECPRMRVLLDDFFRIDETVRILEGLRKAVQKEMSVKLIPEYGTPDPSIFISRETWIENEETKKRRKKRKEIWNRLAKFSRREEEEEYW